MKKRTEYIDKQALLDEAKRMGGRSLTSRWETIGVLALIERQPAVDVEPVKNAPLQKQVGEKATMKKNELAKEYETYESLQKAYDDAEAAKDEAGMEAAKAGYQKLLESLRAKGDDYNFISRLYNDARKRGNEYIDLSEPYQYRDAEKLLILLREYGFDHVTFSSGWSSAVETAWEFTKLGCTIEGMVEINGTSRDFFNGGEYEKAPAYLFKIN